MACTDALQHVANAAGVAPRHAQHLALRKFYYPDTLDWKELVIARGRQVIQQALCGLAQESEV
ncbi:hypothetical protein [Komagataeibacter xylinus]|uniref:Uncharacterized protein n=1 Tax=Komagataeibacter xylinus TaxID=28448 RepID=A0A857FMV7_KOMXY|nr:hypothetical protein [Komagataeibacter xylinus]QHC35591.1 hypothetical protein FMA36_08945 [Komagataeibacter xylinus]